MNTEGRVVVWFSCGAASACAAKFAVEDHSNVKVVYCNTLLSEHPDNKRFMRDVERWINHPIEVISSRKYSTVEDVFSGERYMSGIAGAPCTRELKKIPRRDFQLPNDLHIFGLTYDEGARIERFEKGNPDLELEWNLRDRRITKQACYRILRESGIELPKMYSLGFRNNNCIGCVKATSPGYWNLVRINFPEVFDRRSKQSREIGCRLTRLNGKRIFLDELPMDAIEDQEDIECGPICVQGKLFN